MLEIQERFIPGNEVKYDNHENCWLVVKDDRSNIGSFVSLREVIQWIYSDFLDKVNELNKECTVESSDKYLMGPMIDTGYDFWGISIYKNENGKVIESWYYKIYEVDRSSLRL